MLQRLVHRTRGAPLTHDVHDDSHLKQIQGVVNVNVVFTHVGVRRRVLHSVVVELARLGNSRLLHGAHHGLVH